MVDHHPAAAAPAPPLLRVAGRSLLIGDVPWARRRWRCSRPLRSRTRSPASPSTTWYTGTRTASCAARCWPSAGRTRPNALTAAENTICLAVNQASSIQNYGVTCESFTLGHNPFKLPLSASAIFLPKRRRNFMSEYALELYQARSSADAASLEGISASALMGILTTLELDTFEACSYLRGGERPEHQAHRAPVGQGLAVRGALHRRGWRATSVTGLSAHELMEKQGQLQELYESRIASMQRLVGFFVLFHAMAKRVADFWPAVSFGFLGNDMTRTQSIMRIATTASPVSASDVRHKMVELAEHTAREFCTTMLQSAGSRSGSADTRRRNGSEMSIDQLERQIDALRKLHERMSTRGASSATAAAKARGSGRGWKPLGLAVRGQVHAGW